MDIEDGNLNEFYLKQFSQNASGCEINGKHSDRELEDRAGGTAKEIENCSKESSRPTASAIKAAVVNKFDTVKSGSSLQHSEVESSIPKVLKSVTPDRSKSASSERVAEANLSKMTSRPPEIEPNAVSTCSTTESKEESTVNHADVRLQPGPNERPHAKLRFFSRSLPSATSTRLFKVGSERSDSKKMNNYGVESDAESVNQPAETAKSSLSPIKKILSKKFSKVKANGTFTSSLQENKTKTNKESAANTEKYRDKVEKSPITSGDVFVKEEFGKVEVNRETVTTISPVHLNKSKSKDEAHNLKEQRNCNLSIKSDMEMHGKPNEQISTSQMNSLLNIMSKAKINLPSFFNKPKNIHFESIVAVAKAPEFPTEDTYELDDEINSLNIGDFSAENVRKVKEPVRQRRLTIFCGNRRSVSRRFNPFKRKRRVKGNFKSVSSASRDLPIVRPKRAQIWNSVQSESSQSKKEASSYFPPQNNEPQYYEYEYDEFPTDQENFPSKLNETDDDSYDYFIPDHMTHTGIENHDPKPLKSYPSHHCQIKSELDVEDLYQNQRAIAMNDEMVSPPIPPKIMKNISEMENNFELPRGLFSSEKGEANGNASISKNKLLPSLKMESKHTRPVRDRGSQKCHSEESGHEFDGCEEYEQCVQPAESEKRCGRSINPQSGDEYEQCGVLSSKEAAEYHNSKLVDMKVVSPENAMLEREISDRVPTSNPKYDNALEAKVPPNCPTNEHCRDARCSGTKTSKSEKEKRGQDNEIDTEEKRIGRDDQCQNNRESILFSVEKIDDGKKELLPKKIPPAIPARPRSIPQYILSRQLPLMSKVLEETHSTELKTVSVSEDKRSPMKSGKGQIEFSRASISGGDNFAAAGENDIYMCLDACYS